MVAVSDGRIIVSLSTFHTSGPSLKLEIGKGMYAVDSVHIP